MAIEAIQATPTPAANDIELPADLEAAVTYGLKRSLKVVAENRGLEDEIAALKLDVAKYKELIEIKTTQLADADSRIASAMAIRDDAVAKAATYKAVLIGFAASLRVFEIESSEPLIRNKDEDQEPQIGGA